MSAPQAVAYQALYLWVCPECGTTWQLRHRPRSGSELTCAPLAEQRMADDIGTAEWRGCGSQSVSAGRRKGLAPNVSI